MQISAKTDYAVRALLSLAAQEPELVKIESIVTEQGLPRKFVEAILGELRRAGLVRSQRGADGGYALARSPRDITIGAVMRAVDGPLAAVRGLRPHETEYAGVAEHLPEVWVAVRASLRSVLEVVTLADIVENRLPAVVQEWTSRAGAWESPPLKAD